MAFSSKIKGYTGQNPFSDSQPRSFSDEKIVNEFMPISQYWSLFNDQHEVLLGTRGCGKTFLLKMMRYSMLKTIKDSRAKELVQKKEFIALYVPMHLEIVSPLNQVEQQENQVVLFQVLFNCMLANSIMIEIDSMLEDIEDGLERAQKKAKIARKLDEIWFGIEDSKECDFWELKEKINKLYYNIDWSCFECNSIPVVFKRQICATLLSVKSSICHILEIQKEPTWIVCIDEAEFLNITCQKCINNVFRSDSNRIVIKMATLPFQHRTLETLIPEIVVSDGNDFSYKIVDMDPASLDFIKLTDTLCKHRISSRIGEQYKCDGLEDFVGKVGKDDLIDYYKEIVHEEEASYDVIEKKIIESFPEQRRKNAPNYMNQRKAIYDKYAPIFFLREVYKLSKKGNHKPGWYAGAKMIRKVSQGNPRMFIQIMCSLFDKARETALTPRAQHEVIYKFADDFCEATKALQLEGPTAYYNLNGLAKKIHEGIHGEYLVTGGLSFKASDKDSNRWMEVAIAYSKIIADDETKRRGISTNSKLMLSNAYAVKYWLPMRSSDKPIAIPALDENNTNSYTVNSIHKRKERKEADPNQLTIFEVMNNDRDQ